MVNANLYKNYFFPSTNNLQVAVIINMKSLNAFISNKNTSEFTFYRKRMKSNFLDGVLFSLNFIVIEDSFFIVTY